MSNFELIVPCRSNTTAYPRSYVGPGGAATVYPFQADLARIDTAIVFVTKYSREGYDLTDLKVSPFCRTRRAHSQRLIGGYLIRSLIGEERTSSTLSRRRTMTRLW